MKSKVGTWGVGAIVCLSLAATLGACGSSDDGASTAKGGQGNAGSAGKTGTAGAGGNAGGSGGASGRGGTTSAPGGEGGDIGAGDSGGAESGGSGGQGTGGGSNPPKDTVSNLSGVDFQVTQGKPGTTLVLVSSNLTVDSDVNYVNWFAEVRNDGTKPACFVTAKVDFTTSAGAPVESLMSYADADPYQIGTSSTVSTCIGVGKSGAVWANDLPTGTVDTGSIKVAKVTLSDTDFLDAAVPHPSTPKLTAGSITQHSTLGAGYWSFTGTGSASATIWNVKAQTYMKSAAGLIVDDPAAFHMDTWLSGSAWSFETITGYKGTKPSGQLFFWSFLDGAKTAASIAHPSELEVRVSEAYNAQQAALAATRGRYDRVHGR